MAKSGKLSMLTRTTSSILVGSGLKAGLHQGPHQGKREHILAVIPLQVSSSDILMSAFVGHPLL